MKKLFASSVLLALTLTVSAVQIGDTLDQVIAEKGKPDNKLQAGAVTIVTYAGSTIKLKMGKVVEIKSAEEVANSGTVVTVPMAASPGGWTTEYAAALRQAGNEKKRVFLFFTGSDWCGWCMKLNDEILSTREFINYASKNLILVKLDFPRHMPQAVQLKEQNRQLAEKYGITGFPSVVVLDGSGKPIGELGYMEGGPAGFLRQLNSF